MRPHVYSMKAYPRSAAKRIDERSILIRQKAKTSQPSQAEKHWFWPSHGKLGRAVLPPIEVKSAARTWRWPDFTPAEMACRHCGERFDWPNFMDALQAARDQVGRSFRILSAHRCSLHNARVGGAPQSQHLQLAVDIALRGHDPNVLLAALRDAGFTGFGFYTTFIHADMGRSRQWFGSRKARQIWPA